MQVQKGKKTLTKNMSLQLLDTGWDK